MVNDTPRIEPRRLPIHLARMSPQLPALPHDPWADHYESVMALTFGDVYEQMTSSTLAEVDRLVPADATILDLGAGAGRMALPLARSGRRVIAVDRSERMLAVLQRSSSALDPEVAGRIEPVRAAISEPGPIGPVDLVLCVFTVVAYCLTENELRSTFRAAFEAMPAGGPFLLDVPQPEIFESMEIESGDLIRTVSMDEVDPGIHEYREHTVLRTPGGPIEYRDSFRLRLWSSGEIERGLSGSGFTTIEDVTDRFPDLGARYLVAHGSGVTSSAE